jgi:hypothetical protein
MKEQDTFQADEAVTDLGAATTMTLGVWDPNHSEGLIYPDMRD